MAPADATAAPISEAARRVVDELMQHRAAWAATPLAARVEWLRRAADALRPTDAALGARWHALADTAEFRLAPQALPGPTGESNELRLHGRGLFAFVGANGAPLADLGAALAAALVAGNPVAWVADEATLAANRGWVDALQQAGLPAHTLARLPGSFDGLGSALLADARIAGVVATASELLPRVARQLAAQEGAIVPLLALHEAANARQLYRFCAEQTLTINTAAAGGNAALLAAGV
ncbi:MAG TPA: aldehyde dehydrogenase family protein [Ideonella sp.]|nr:aldehyde dehydrogenase family protein [Ideonella sp.]